MNGRELSLAKNSEKPKKFCVGNAWLPKGIIKNVYCNVKSSAKGYIAKKIQESINITSKVV